MYLCIDCYEKEKSKLKVLDYVPEVRDSIKITPSRLNEVENKTNNIIRVITQGESDIYEICRTLSMKRDTVRKYLIMLVKEKRIRCKKLPTSKLLIYYI
jgi:predicted transcriptional regulator